MLMYMSSPQLCPEFRSGFNPLLPVDKYKMCLTALSYCLIIIGLLRANTLLETL